MPEVRNLFRYVLILAFPVFPAAAQKSFDCDEKLYYFAEDADNVWLVSIEGYENNSPVSTVVCQLPGKLSTTVNALGANPIDGFLYFLERDPNAANEARIRRLTGTCNVPIVCPYGNNPPVPYAIAGCFDHLGRYWIIDSNQLTAWDITTCSIVKGPYNVGSSTSNDIIYNTRDCHLYTGDLKIDLNGNITVLPSGKLGGAGIALGVDGHVYSVGNGNKDSIEVNRYDLSDMSKSGIGFVYPGTVNGSDMASFPCGDIDAEFFLSTLSGCAPWTLTPVDSSTGLITSRRWDFGDGTTSDLPDPSHTYTAPGTYIVTLIASGTSTCLLSLGDTLTDTVTVGSAGVSAGSTPVSCAGGSDGTAGAGPTAGQAPFTYLWSSGATAASLTGLPAGNYSVTITDASGCTDSASVTIAEPTPVALSFTPSDVLCNGGSTGSISLSVSGGTPSYFFVWNNGATGQNPAGLSAGSYSVTVTDARGCSSTDSATVGEPPPLALNPASTDASCGNSDGTVTVVVAGGVPGYTYQWSSGGSGSTQPGIAAGTYSVTVTDANGCTATASAAVGGTTGPVAGFSAPGRCVNDAVNFTNSSAGGTSWSWDFGDSATSSQRDPYHTYTSPGTKVITLAVTDSAGCSDTATQTITIHALPIVAFSDSLSGCSPVTATFVNGSGTGTYSWEFGDPSSGTDNFSDLTSPIHTFVNVTAFPLTFDIKMVVTSPFGCTDSLSRPQLITVFPLTSAGFVLSPEKTSIISPTITFTDLSSGATQWSWDFGDGSGTSSARHPIYTYDEPRTYTVCLGVVNDYGCPDSVCREVAIDPIWTFYIPNVFSPNGDGLNEGFIGKGLNVTEHEMWIFDRWGNLIYTTGRSATLEEAVPWDGRANGGEETAQEDTYVWLVTFRDIFGGSHRRIGHVSIIK